MRFYNHRSSTIFNIYLKLYDSEPSFEKKLIFKSLLVGESWSSKVTGISKLCLESFKKNKFEKSRKLKKKRQTVKNVIRHQLTNILKCWARPVCTCVRLSVCPSVRLSVRLCVRPWHAAYLPFTHYLPALR